MIRTNYDGCPGQEECQNDERDVARAVTWTIQSSTEPCFPIQTKRPADRHTYGSKGLQVATISLASQWPAKNLQKSSTSTQRRAFLSCFTSLNTHERMSIL